MDASQSVRRPLFWQVLRFLAKFAWSALAMHGVMNLTQPTPLRESLWLMVPIGLVAAVMLGLVSYRQRRHLVPMERRWREIWTGESDTTASEAQDAR